MHPQSNAHNKMNISPFFHLTNLNLQSFFTIACSRQWGMAQRKLHERANYKGEAQYCEWEKTNGRLGTKERLCSHSGILRSGIPSY